MSDRQEKPTPERAPRRELDEPKNTPRAGTPVGLIRRPVQLPPMERVQK
jgi:hypothetical protein